MKAAYYQFVNFIQGLSNFWFYTIWFVLFAAVFALVIKFFKIYNGSQKKFEKISLFILAILLFVLIVYLTYLRN